MAQLPFEIFDGDNQRKPCYASIIDVLLSAPPERTRP